MGRYKFQKTVLNTRHFLCALMKTETFENVDAAFDSSNVDHKNKKIITCALCAYVLFPLGVRVSRVLYMHFS